MSFADEYVRDVMQVCRNGHVITDLLHSLPERSLSHCDRCGAATYDRCLTCGQRLEGGIYIPEAVPIGKPRAPQYCSACGASFPWTRKPASDSSQNTVSMLEILLRKLPAVARQLRVRHGNRPAFRVEDDYDVADLLRALLPLHFTDVRPESRAPRYAGGNHTDFLLSRCEIALTAKQAHASRDAQEIESQLREDVSYYQRRGCRTLVVLVYDPESRLCDPSQLETTWNGLSDNPCVRAVIAS